MKLETHVHTKYSNDSLLYFWPLYIKCRLLGIDSIAITEHNNIDGGMEFQRFCQKHGGKIHVIVGEEVFTDSGEIIGLYLTSIITPGLSVKETINEIKRQDGVVYIPHPYDKKRKKTVLREEAISDCRGLIDCIEIHNGRNISKEYDKKQKEIAERYDIKSIVGSDAHTWIEIGRNYMKWSGKPPLCKEDFLEILNKAEFNEKKCLVIAHKITVLAKIVKMIKKGCFNELYRVIFRKIKRG